MWHCLMGLVELEAPHGMSTMIKVLRSGLAASSSNHAIDGGSLF